MHNFRTLEHIIIIYSVNPYSLQNDFNIPIDENGIKMKGNN